MVQIKPFIKWAGGKSQLLPEIRPYYPSRIKKYAEPFIGGGAVLLDVLETFDVEQAVINDVNPELTNLYSTIKNDVENLIDTLKAYRDEYSAISDNNQKKDYYLDKRTRFNELIATKTLSTETAALFIFINKTCFNGLYRVNAKGLFNVPFNGAKNPALFDEENLRQISRKLRNVTITNGDYKTTENFIDEDTFVYLDPPYRPLTVSASFTSYSEKGFDDNDQIELSHYARKLAGKGAKVLLSNSDPKNTNENDNFFDDLYSDFYIHRISATRMINSKASGRGKINELLITNIKPTNYGKEF